jgi:hypothetical protein
MLLSVCCRQLTQFLTRVCEKCNDFMMIYHIKINNVEPFINETAAGILNEFFHSFYSFCKVLLSRTTLCVLLYCCFCYIMCVHSHNKNFMKRFYRNFLVFFPAEIALLRCVPPFFHNKLAMLLFGSTSLAKVKSNKSSKR